MTTIISVQTTKKIKSKHLEEPNKNLIAVNDGTNRYHVGTIVFKVFGKVEHRGTVSGYDPMNKLYHAIWDDADTEEYYNNEVRNQQKRFLSKKSNGRNPSQQGSITCTPSMPHTSPIMCNI